MKYHFLFLTVNALILLALSWPALAQEPSEEPDRAKTAEPDAATEEEETEPREETDDEEQADSDEQAAEVSRIEESEQAEQQPDLLKKEPAPEKEAPEKVVTEEPEDAERLDPFAGFDQAFEEQAGVESDAIGEQGEKAPSVHVHGSLENQLTGSYLRRSRHKDRFSLNDYTRLRIDVDADLPADVQVRSDAVARLFVGETEFDLVDLIPEDTFDELIASDARWAFITAGGQLPPYTMENELYLDNAYMKVPAGSMLFVIGKQPLEQGAGYVWNPTDVFIDKDIFDPTYEKPGIIALRATVPIGSIASVDLMAVPEGIFEHWSAGGRASLRLGPLTLGPACFLTREERTDLIGSIDAIETAILAGADPQSAMNNILIANARRVMVGGEAILDVHGVRLWVEGAHNLVQKKTGAPDDWWELVSGVEYFFEFETHVMAEYYHYGRGPEQSNNTYDLNAWMGLLAAELKMLGNDFLFASVDHPLADFWTVGLSSIQSFTDLSAAIMADVKWDFIEDGEIWLLLAGNVGQSGDLLSVSPGQGWLRAKVYF